MGLFAHVGEVDHVVVGSSALEGASLLDGGVHQLLGEKEDFVPLDDLLSSPRVSAVHAGSAADVGVSELPRATGVMSGASDGIELCHSWVHATAVVLEVVDRLVVETTVKATIDAVQGLQVLLVADDQFLDGAGLLEGDDVVVGIDDRLSETAQCGELVARLSPPLLFGGRGSGRGGGSLGSSQSRGKFGE